MVSCPSPIPVALFCFSLVTWPTNFRFPLTSHNTFSPLRHIDPYHSPVPSSPSSKRQLLSSSFFSINLPFGLSPLFFHLLPALPQYHLRRDTKDSTSASQRDGHTDGVTVSFISHHLGASWPPLPFYTVFKIEHQPLSTSIQQLDFENQGKWDALT